jgi:hypothetical protein
MESLNAIRRPDRRSFWLCETLADEAAFAR